MQIRQRPIKRARIEIIPMIDVIFFLLVLFAFHPWSGLVDAYRDVTGPEYYFAMVLATAISIATLWRLVSGSTIREELKRASDSIHPGRS